MSYILDALKKADAERERGTVPGLHSQPLGQVDDADDDDDDGARKAMPPMVWLGAGVGLCLIAVLSWQLLASKKDEASVASAPMAEQAMAPVPPGELPQQAPQQAQPKQQDIPPQGMAPSLPPPRPQPMGQQQGMAAPTRPAKPFSAEPVKREAPPAVNNTPQAQATASSPAKASVGERVPSVNELPEDVRHSLPQLVIGGAMYSDTPSSRMLIVNSQVFHEGDQPYQGLVLEEIKLKSAVFRYRGYRYAVNY